MTEINSIEDIQRSYDGELHDFSGFKISQDVGCLKVPEASFVDCEISNTTLDGGQEGDRRVSLEKVQLSNCKWAGVRARNGSLVGFSASNWQFFSVNLQGSDCTRASFTGCVLHNGNFRSCKFHSARFIDSDLRGVDFEGADLTNATFNRVLFNKENQFKGATLEGLRIDRQSLEAIPESVLSRGERMGLQVEDDAVLLREEFTGLTGAIQTAGLLAFLTPYFWVVLVKSMESYWGQPGSVSLLEYLGRYAWSAGNPGAGFSAWSLITLALILFNVLRFFLLYKAKNLEKSEAIRGLPVLFSLDEKWFWKVSWRKALNTFRWLMWLNITLVVIHSFVFLWNTRVTLP